MIDAELRARFERWMLAHVGTGPAADPRQLCADRPDLAQPLADLIAEFHLLERTLDTVGIPPPSGPPDESGPMPVFEGFRTIERIGTGGMGEVYKLQDVTLNRMVAAKVLRADRRLVAGLDGFLGEARALALFDDPRIVRVHEFRPDATPPVLIMEYVEGFELGRVAASLEYPQRARILRDVCDAIHHAHQLGLQHRDLKPSNIMLDAQLRPRILDFGLSAGDPTRGHFRGTPRYLAPEQLDPDAPIDARSDIYALGAVLYELICGQAPFDGPTDEAVLDAVRRGTPPLPVDIAPGVPEPLQAIALKALERRPADRYASAHEMALDLDRYLDGRPVNARPSQYSSALATRVRPHIAQIEDWLRLKLVYPHEAIALRGAYRRLDRRDDDWIGESRALSYSQIALYLGAFVLMSGSLFYFGVQRYYETVSGLLRPFIVLGLPFLGLNAAAHTLERRQHKAVAVAFYLGGISLLPLFLLILFNETKILVVPHGSPGQLFDKGVSNAQLQVTVLCAWLWTAWLAWRTRTIALSTIFAFLTLLLALAILSDFGLRDWLVNEHWDRLALHLLPLLVAYAALGGMLERAGLNWFCRPLYTAAGVTLVTVLELLAQNGRLFEYLGGISLQRFQDHAMKDAIVINTMGAMSLNGMVFHACAAFVDRKGSDMMRTAAWMLFTISPFAILEPLAYLGDTGNYSKAVDWTYLGLALVIALISHVRQRKSFYYAGLVNTGFALWLIADHNNWLNKPTWAEVLVAAGLIVLAVGFGLDARERRRQRPGT